LLIVFDLGWRLANPTAGLASLLTLISIRTFGRYSHKAFVDPMLMLFVLLGFCAYLWSVWDLRRRADGTVSAAPRVRVSAMWMFGVYLAASLAYYVKGPVGIIAVAGPIAFDVLIFRRFRALLSAGHFVGIPMLLAAIVSWPWLLYSLEGEAALLEFVVQNGLYRVAPGAGVYYGGHEYPFSYHFEAIPAHFTWWIAAFPAIAMWLFRGKFPVGWNLGALRFMALVFPAGLLLLSIPGTKRVLYLLPFIPPASVAIGAWVAAMCMSDPARSRVERATGVASAAIAGWILRPIAALMAWGPMRAVSRTLFGRDGSGLRANLREEPAQAAANRDVRAPLRFLWLAFAVAMAWNFFGYPRLTHARHLGPMSH
jgi:4-amino-4-deoxy-L-arabinose transferase-like glycosyltransferase